MVTANICGGELKAAEETGAILDEMSLRTSALLTRAFKESSFERCPSFFTRAAHATRLRTMHSTSQCIIIMELIGWSSNLMSVHGVLHNWN